MAPNFGIEYELEDTSLSLCPDGWRAERDGTLRGDGVEFILDGKATPTNAKSLVSRLLESIGDMYSISHRCSTHIHIDTQGLNGYARVALYLGLAAHDNWFFQYGRGREVNSFCCPTLYSPAVLCGINQATRANDWRSGERRARPSFRDVINLCEMDTKYLSLNTMTLGTLGTIELRHFEPIMREADMTVILDKLTAIYNVARTVGAQARVAAGTVWTDFDPSLKEEIEWVQGMYTLHNSMVGLEEEKKAVPVKKKRASITSSSIARPAREELIRPVYGDTMFANTSSPYPTPAPEWVVQGRATDSSDTDSSDTDSSDTDSSDTEWALFVLDTHRGED